MSPGQQAGKETPKACEYMLFLSRYNQSKIEFESQSQPNQSLHNLNPTIESTVSRSLSSTTKAISRKVRTGAWPALRTILTR